MARTKDDETKVTKLEVGNSEELTAIDNADNVEELTVINNDDDVEEIIITPKDEEVDNVIELSKKYKFDSKIIDKIDLTGIEMISGEYAADIEKLYRKISKSPTQGSPEITLDYAIATASMLTGLPVEFFRQISFKDIIKMKNRIINFLYGD